MTARVERPELRRLRLAAQSLAGVPADSVLAAASRMTASQAQDLGAAQAALALRAGTRPDAVAAAFASGEIVRSWPMRGTLMALAAGDLRWLLELTSARQLRAQTLRRERLGISSEVLAVARRAASTLLQERENVGRAALLAAFAAAGIETAAGRGYHLILHLSQEGVLLWGPLAASGQLLRLVDAWVPASAPLERDEALGRLLVRYLAGHGPARAADLAWWSGLPLGDIRRGAAVAGDAVVELDTDGTRFLALAATAQTDAPQPAGPRALLLPAFDEYLLGYQNRDELLAPEHFAKTVPGGNGVFKPVIVIDGEIVGTWSGKPSSAEPQPFEPLSGPADAALRAAVAELTQSAPLA